MSSKPTRVSSSDRWEAAGAGAVSLLALADELEGARLVAPRGTEASAIVVSGVRQDSRGIEPGELFVALRGERADGAKFISAAADRGAVAVMLEQGRDAVDCHGLVRLEVGLPRVAMARAAAFVYGRPTTDLEVVGITGTNGKTTTAQLLHTCLAGCAVPTAVLGTLGLHFGDLELGTIHTSPEADELQRLAAMVRDRGASHLVMEVSSIALAAQRVHGVRFRVAAFTNLTQDHLDYHGTMAAYAAAKDRLFFELHPAVAVIDVDDAHGASLADRWAADRGRGELLRVSSRPEARADVRPRELTQTAHGIRMVLQAPSGAHELTAPLVGAHNVSNLLCAAAVVEALGLDLAAAAEALRLAPAVPGRLERCDAPGQDDIVAVVDYAHTPDALERVLASVRHLTTGRLWCVFGCGGDRDTGKRAPMGAAVGRVADYAIITNDNPRGEEPQRIVDAVVVGIDKTHGRYEVELDRGRAIARAIADAAAGDVVVVAGKGHEPYQMVGDEVMSFDDREQVRAALAKRRGRRRG